MMYGNANITITRYKNMWLVILPFKRDEHGINQIIPMVQKVMKIQHEDPLLNKLRGEEEEHFAVHSPLDILPENESLYIFKTWKEVLNLLSEMKEEEDPKPKKKK